MSAVEEGFDREELEDLKNNSKLLLDQICSMGAEVCMNVYRNLQYINANLIIEDEKEDPDFEVLAVLPEKMKEITNKHRKWFGEEFLSLPHKCTELKESLNNICYQLFNAKQFRELAILAQYKQQLTNTKLEVEPHILEELRSFEAQCQALLQESITFNDSSTLQICRLEIQCKLENAQEEADRIQLEGELQDIDIKINELPLFDAHSLPARLSELQDSLYSYEEKYRNYRYHRDILSKCQKDLSNISLSSGVVDGSVVSFQHYDRTNEGQLQLQEDDDEMSALTVNIYPN